MTVDVLGGDDTLLYLLILGVFLKVILHTFLFVILRIGDFIDDCSR